MRNIDTDIVRGSSCGNENTGAVSVPIYQSATFSHPSLGETTGWDYTRQGNPTRKALEMQVALLERGDAGFAFSSGMAAMCAVLDLLTSGDHVVLSEDLYGGTYRLFDTLGRSRGICFDFVDTADFSALERSLLPTTKLLVVETPSNPMMRVSDIRRIASLARMSGCLLVVDNTFMSPYLQRPLELGADLVLHSGTKYLAGHNDTLCGFLVSSRRDLSERLALIQKTTGSVLGPFDCWLALRGMKTLAVRMERQQANALELARRLTSHPAVSRVHYVGLDDHPGKALCLSQSFGSGAMISFAVTEASLVPKVLSGLRLILFAESLGGVESLITYPMTQTHAAIPEEVRTRLGVNETLLRLSVGIENVEDLWADIDQALRL